jgi:hypothetical protein
MARRKTTEKTLGEIDLAIELKVRAQAKEAIESGDMREYKRVMLLILTEMMSTQMITNLLLERVYEVLERLDTKAVASQ